MKTFRFITMLIAIIGFVLAYQASAQQDTAPSYGSVSGDTENGKALFNDKSLGNSTVGKSCSSCHPGGRGLEEAGGKNIFNIMGKTQRNLEDAVNFCIINALRGKAIDPYGKDMKDIVSYIRSLKK